MAPSLHARLSPSSSDIWLNCPYAAHAMLFGSYPERPIYSNAAAIGTAKHSLAEKFSKSRNPQTLLSPLEGQYGHLSPKEMLAIKMVMASIWDEPWAELSIEQKLQIRLANTETFGTADIIAWLPLPRILRIVDYKFGRIDVSPDCNQLKLYALGGLQAHNDKRIKHVEAVIVQPNSQGMTAYVKSHTYKPKELEDFGNQPVAFSKDPCPGNHCRWCSLRESGACDVGQKFTWNWTTPKLELTELTENDVNIAYAGWN